MTVIGILANDGLIALFGSWYSLQEPSCCTNCNKNLAIANRSRASATHTIFRWHL